VRGRRGRGLGSRAHPRLPLERLGAKPWASRAAVELQATGQTHAGADQPARDRLTPQERLIAMLAAAGLANKEIGQQLSLSHRTVGAHLYQIFPKLGITTRAALREALASQPLSATARIAADRYLKTARQVPGTPRDDTTAAAADHRLRSRRTPGSCTVRRSGAASTAADCSFGWRHWTVSSRLPSSANQADIASPLSGW
jgi:DNA-binding CsgD family transcriptional regulator